MPEIALIPFKAEHWQQIGQADKPFLDALGAAEREGLAWTAIADGKVVGCGGIKLFWDGVGEAWAAYPADRRRWAFAIARITKRMLRTIMREHHLRRVQAVVVEGFPCGMRFARWLGFTLEGRMARYAPDGQDAYLYSLVGDNDER